jgi:uncharacterized protein YlxP (DUF503 family)
VPGSSSLKDKRRVVRSVRDVLRERVGASVAEVGGHDSRSTALLLGSLSSRDSAELGDRLARLGRLVDERCPGTAEVSSRRFSAAELFD